MRLLNLDARGQNNLDGYTYGSWLVDLLSNYEDNMFRANSEHPIDSADNANMPRSGSVAPFRLGLTGF